MTNSIAETLNKNASNRLRQEETQPIESIPNDSMTTNNDNNSLATIDVASPLITGEITTNDIQIPQLQICQPMSQSLQDMGIPTGHLALNRMADLGKACEIVVAGVDISLLEALDYGAQEQARRFATEAEAIDAGYTLNYNSPKPRVDKVADFRLLVKGPEDDNTGLFTQISKSVGSWTQAMFTAKGTNYRLFAKPVLTAATYGHLKTDLLKGLWKIESQEQSNGKNRWWAIKPTPLENLDEKTVKALREAFNIGG